MRLRSTLPLMAVGLILSTPAFAQNAPDGALPQPPQPPRGPSQATGPHSQLTTQSSRIRAFNAGPDGQVRSLYLQNGSVVNVSPDLGRQLSTQTHKGTRITVTGSRSMVNGQRILAANQISINSQTYTAQLQGGPEANFQGGPDRGPRVGRIGEPGMMPPPHPGPDARVDGPKGPRGPRPERRPGTPPPPPPGGPDAHIVGGRPVPPPPPNGGGHGTLPNAAGHGDVPMPPPAPGDPAGQPGQGTPNPAQTSDPNSAAPIPQRPPAL